ncbi:MAG: HAD family hydrolase [Ruminococcaceae bacterium]|nr:HAD family hydrolase [Oscillospiraceae bacterium]
MALTAVLFDLDGTLLPMDQDIFINAYFRGIAAKLAPMGYDPKELINAIWGGTIAMIKNNGEKNNEEVFWDYFCGIYGENAREDEPHFAAFYETEFQKVQEVCGFDPNAAKTVRSLKERGIRVILATNPIFPAIATQSRIRWAGMEPADFELITTYENIGRSKPYPAYYEEILRRQNLRAEECLMVGNDVRDDMVAEKLGMKVFLLTDNLINKADVDISVFPNGGFDQLQAYIDHLIQEN